jgi:hypothetical protein
MCPLLASWREFAAIDAGGGGKVATGGEGVALSGAGAPRFEEALNRRAAERRRLSCPAIDSF